jgi:hypothetical protein
MCRIFAFRAAVNTTVHHSLIRADNAFCDQSARHPDGWGVAFYVNDTPHLVRSLYTAQTDALFQHVSGVVSSQTFIAHLRKATVGETNILNAHPFQHGKWVFAHNGNVKDFAAKREAIINKIKPNFRRYILGATDSEVIFHLILTHLSDSIELNNENVPIEVLFKAIETTFHELEELGGPMYPENDGPPTENYYTMIITNGTTMAGFHGGKLLYYSTYKARCSVRSSCQFFAPECEAFVDSGHVNHLLVSSEVIAGENIWFPMSKRQMIGVDGRMIFTSKVLD